MWYSVKKMFLKPFKNLSVKGYSKSVGYEYFQKKFARNVSFFKRVSLKVKTFVFKCLIHKLLRQIKRSYS